VTNSDGEQPKIPERWRQFYAAVCRAAKFFRNTDPSPAKSLIEELGTAEARVAELEARVERLSAPVSDEEWRKGYEFSWSPRSFMMRETVDALIAARKVQP